MTAFARAFAVVALATLARAGLADRGALWQALPLGQRARLLAGELALVGLAVAACAATVAAYRRRRAAPGRRATIALLALAALPWAASWEAFTVGGRFLGPAAARFASVGGWQLVPHLLHIDPLAPLRVLAWAALVAVAIERLARRELPARPALAAWALLALLALLGPAPDPAALQPIADPDAGMVFTDGDLYAECRAERTGPLTHLLAAATSARDEEAPPVHVDRGIPATNRPLDTPWTGDPAHRWNVLLVVVESLRRDQLLCTGGTREVMPTVERLARRARVYPDTLANATHSNYADPCLLSSHYPLRSPRTHVYPPDPSYPRVLLYDLLARHGWRTALISSQDERWGGMLDYLRTPGLQHLFHAGNAGGPTYRPLTDAGAAAFRSGKLDDRRTIDEAIRWTAAGPEPWFCYLNLQNSHLPYTVPDGFPRRFSRGPPSVTISFAGYPGSAVPAVRDAYADSLAYVDAQLARLVEHLRTTGQLARTLVVVTSDTGQAFMEHGAAGHAGALFREQLEIPLLFAVPGGEATVDRRPAMQIDVPPTVLGLLGLPPHPSHQGRDLASSPTPRHRYLVVQTPLAHQYGVAHGALKLVHDARAGRALLFDRARDPDETADHSRAFPRQRARLQRRLDTWRARQLEYYADRALHGRTYPPDHAD